jgi:hypothetical protein
MTQPNTVAPVVPATKPSRRPDTAPIPPRTRPPEADADYLAYLRSLVMAARKDKQQRIDGWNRNVRIVNNRYQSASFVEGAPQPRDSEVYPILSSLVAWMTDQEADVGFTPAADPSGAYFAQIQRVTADLNSVFHTSWVNEEFDREFKRMMWDGFITGTGVVKSVWDNAAGGGAGNARVRRIDPYRFYPDPSATTLDECEFMVEVHRMSFDQIQRMYPDTAHVLLTGGAEILDERPRVTGGSGQPRANLGFLPSGNGMWGNKRPNGGPPQAGTIFTVYEYWLKENTFSEVALDDQSPGDNAYAIPRWKCVVTCGANLLYEEWAEDLWSHKGHPYDCWSFDDIGEFWGVSLVDHLALPQLYINRLLTSMQLNAELTGNPIFIEAANSGTPRAAINNRPGERITVSGNAVNANTPRWMVPPSMPSQVMDLVNFWISRIENTAGINGMQKGQDPTQRVSGNTVSNVQEAAFVRIRSALTNLGWTYRRSAQKLVSLIAQNFTEQRIMAVIGPDGEATSLWLRPFHFYDPATDHSAPLEFHIRADAGSNQATSRQARVSQANTLYAMGAVDDAFVLQANGIRDVAQLLQRKYLKMQQGLLGGAGGARQRAGRTR